MGIECVLECCAPMDSVCASVKTKFPFYLPKMKRLLRADNADAAAAAWGSCSSSSSDLHVTPAALQKRQI